MLSWLESTALAVWLAESTSVWSLPTVLTLHTTGMAILAGACWTLDLRLLGISKNVPLSAFRWVFPAVGLGLFLNVVTGVMLFTKSATTLGTSVPFLIKMVFVVASVATIIPIRNYVLGDTGGEEVSARIRFLAVASILVWTAAMTAGRLLAYVVI